MLNILFILINSLIGIYISTPKVLLPNSIAQFNMKIYKSEDKLKDLQHWDAMVLYSNIICENIPVRIHDQCMTSEIFGSMRCDCREQLYKSMEIIKDTGMIIYLPNEGRGIGLYNKILTYKLQENGFDTFNSHHVLNLPVELREYSIIPKILNDFDIKSINLITNNKYKIKKLQEKNIKINKIINLNSSINSHNEI